MVIEYVNRASAALYRQTLREGVQFNQPSSDSGIRADSNGRKYVVLENISGVLAVYRIKTDGTLRRMKRWPKEIETEDAALPFG